MAASVAPDRARVRLAELVASLSLGVDLGFGQPMEHVLRQCLIALRLAECVGLDPDERLVVYYTSLFVNVGCHSDAHEQAKWFGDDIALKSLKYEHDPGSAGGAAAAMRLLGSGHPPLHRFRVGLEFAFAGAKDLKSMINRHAALARILAEQLGLPLAVQEAVGASYEQWDGRGWPGQLKGAEVPMAARLTQLAEFIEVAHRVGGVAAATQLARRRAGKQFDPQLCDQLCANAEEILNDTADAHSWESVIDAEPALALWLTGEDFEAALVAVADCVDLKTPYLLGHARAVSQLAAAAGSGVGLAADDLRDVRRAGLVHGLGRLGISNAIWDKPGPLGFGEWERVRLQPYLTERMLHQSESLAPIGAIAVQLRERLDGSGYPHGLSGSSISMPARILAAADIYQSMCEPRPYRSAFTAAESAGALREEVKRGRVDGDAAEALLAAAGHRVPKRRETPGGLSPREIEVLRLLARGLSGKQVAAQLFITPKTARNHVEHIYLKIGATSRATAALYAMQNGLLTDDGTAADPPYS
jgi:HD-GYP domain-containing protein (c-di-GMP phosphodiesterase class II)